MSRVCVFKSHKCFSEYRKGVEDEERPSRTATARIEAIVRKINETVWKDWLSNDRRYDWIVLYKFEDVDQNAAQIGGRIIHRNSLHNIVHSLNSQYRFSLKLFSRCFSVRLLLLFRASKLHLHLNTSNMNWSNSIRFQRERFVKNS